MFPCEIPRNADLYVSSAFVLLAARKQTPQLFRKKNVVSHQSPRASEESGAQNHQQVLQSQHRVTPSFHFPEPCGGVLTAVSLAHVGPGNPSSTGGTCPEPVGSLCAQTVAHSTRRSESPGLLRSPARQLSARGNPSRSSRTHHQKRRLEEQPMERDRGGDRKHRGDDE